MATVVPVTRRKAQRQACKASIMIEGLSGTGKTGLALDLAYVLSGKDYDLVDITDTENHSADLYENLTNIWGAPITNFNVTSLDDSIGYKPSYYLQLRQEAVDAGSKVWIADSISHAWQYRGGILDMVNNVADASSNKDKYAAWKDPEVAAEKNNLLPLIRANNIHVITTVRVKEKMEYVEKDTGVGKKLQSLGEQQLQQADLKYEPDLVLHTISPACTNGTTRTFTKVRVIKSRYAILEKDNIYECTPKLLEQLQQYLAEGVDPKDLLESQRQDYIDGIKRLLDAQPGKKVAWKVLKDTAGMAKTPLNDISLEILRKLWTDLN